jgi:4-hydroxybenzoate polyprenyltransferase
MKIARALLRAMRPAQWFKNVFIFPALVFDGQLFMAEPFIRTAFGFVLLCMAASAIYLINDVLDVEKDRLHPKKKYRPIASGALTVPTARAAAVVLMALSVGLGFLLLSAGFAVTILLYLILHIAYSFKLKQIVLIDVFAVAGGYLLRVVAGVSIIDVARFSPWLYVFATLLAFFLAVGKRRQELILLAGNAENVRATYKDYNMPLLDDMLRLVVTGAFLTYVFYTFEAATAVGGYGMMLTIPFVLYGVFRYLYVIHVSGHGGAPEEVFMTDRPLQLTLVLYGVATIIIIYVLPHLGMTFGP